MRTLRCLAAFVATAAFAAVSAPASAALPQVSIRSGPIVDEPKVEARMTARGTGTAFRGRIGIERRGNSSARFAKRSYAFETRGARGKEGRAVALLGLPRGSDWTLISAAVDETLMRNVVAYETVRRLGGSAPRTRYVELRLNGRYDGVYVLTPRVKLRGGAIAELTNTYDGIPVGAGPASPSEDGFRGPGTGRPYGFHELPGSKESDGDRRALASAVAAMEQALYTPGGTWRAELDERSAVDYLLAQELFKNQDAFISSTFLGRRGSGRLQLGPIWDFDRSMGDNNAGPQGPDGWITFDRPLAERLLADPGFVTALGQRWAAVKARVLPTMLDAVTRADRALRGASLRNARRWPATRRYAPEVRRLRVWLTARVAWMDANFPSLRRGA